MLLNDTSCGCFLVTSICKLQIVNLWENYKRFDYSVNVCNDHEQVGDFNVMQWLIDSYEGLRAMKVKELSNNLISDLVILIVFT